MGTASKGCAGGFGAIIGIWLGLIAIALIGCVGSAILFVSCAVGTAAIAPGPSSPSATPEIVPPVDPADADPSDPDDPAGQPEPPQVDDADDPPADDDLDTDPPDALAEPGPPAPSPVSRRVAEDAKPIIEAVRRGIASEPGEDLRAELAWRLQASASRLESGHARAAGRSADLIGLVSEAVEHFKAGDDDLALEALDRAEALAGE